MITNTDKLVEFLEAYSAKIKSYQAGYTSEFQNGKLIIKEAQIMSDTKDPKAITPEQQKLNREKAKRMSNDLVIRDLRRTSGNKNKNKDKKYNDKKSIPETKAEAPVISLQEFRSRRDKQNTSDS